MSYATPPRTAEQFEAMRAYMAKDLAQGSVALSQLVKERKVRMMGALRDGTPPTQQRMVLIAHRVVNICEAFLKSYYLPIFARYWELRMRYEQDSNERKVHEVTRKLMNFAGSYSLYAACHEAGMTVFDMKFDQYHTVSTMLGIQEEEDETRQGVTWVAADVRRMESKTTAQQIARHENTALGAGKSSAFPTFGEAVMLAKEQMITLLDITPTVPIVTPRPKPERKPSKKKKPSLGASKQTEEVLTPNDDNGVGQ